ncbi:unnamed protein product, partial [Closterium sp. NIES-53]
STFESPNFPPSPTRPQLSPYCRRYMNDNAFGGSIPAYIGSFLSLSYLRLSNNMFSGNIPKELSRLKSLQFLGLRYNWLTGSIPAALASLPQLTYLSASIPSPPPFPPPASFSIHASCSISHVALLCHLLVSITPITLQLTPLGAAFHFQHCSPSTLQSLSLNYNKLSGSIPAQLTRLANIQSINLESNYLSGTLPNIDRLKLLTDIHASNYFVGEVSYLPPFPTPPHPFPPHPHGNVRSNYLSGTIPPRYLLLPHLSLSSNYFVGESLTSHLTLPIFTPPHPLPPHPTHTATCAPTT